MEQRSLVFDAGTSDKFWAIRVDGATHTVHYGRAGTAGQVKTKEFASEAQAAASAQRLVDEKLRKGYRDSGTPAGVPDPVEPAAVRAEPEPPPPAAPEPAAAPVVDDRPPIDLTPTEWAIATWRPLPVPPAVEPRPFDPAVLREAIRDHAEWQWRRSPIQFPMTRQEAAYWLRITQRLAYRETLLQRHAAVLEQPPDLEPEAAIALARRTVLPIGDAMVPLVTLLGADQVLELLLTPRSKPDDESPALRFYAGIRPYLLPLLAAADHERLRARAHDWLQEALRDPEYRIGDAATLAAQVGGLHDLVEEVCARWPDDWFSSPWSTASSYGPIAHGVRSAEAFEALVARVKMRFVSDYEVAGWLAQTELRRLDWLVTGALRTESKEDAAVALGAIARRLHAVEAAPAMLELQAQSRTPSVARAWLVDHPRQTAYGLAPLVSRSGRLADAARDELKRMARGPSRSVLEEVADALPADDRARFNERVLDAALPATPELADPPAWLAEADARSKRTALPAWLDVATLPSLEVEGGSLGPHHLPAVLRLLRAGDPATVALREHVTTASAEELAWALFNAWLLADAPSKDKWAFTAMGALGGDHCASRLAPLIRAWPGESQHKRAVLGLDVLRAIGSDVALMQLNGIAQKLKFKALKERAHEAMEEIARDKGMSKSELEDRIVPDCGLDERGTRVFDFGPRQFELVLGPGMKPMLRDGDGKVRTALPKPGAKDDEALATAATADWKLARKTVADVAKVQGSRLEQAMVSGRRWSAGDFDALLARHPLQRHLVRPLVLGTYRGRALEATFRLTEEGDLADAGDDPFVLGPDAQVGIAHPLDLDEAQLAAWGELLADYELVPPFPQLGRPSYDIEPGEATATVLTRFRTHRIAPATLVRLLETMEWTRGAPQDGGVFALHTKHFPGTGCTAVVEYEDGVPVGYLTEADPQTLERVYVLRGRVDREELGWGWDAPSMPWQEVDRVVRSEILSDVHDLIAKAEPGP